MVYSTTFEAWPDRMELVCERRRQCVGVFHCFHRHKTELCFRQYMLTPDEQILSLAE